MDIEEVTGAGEGIRTLDPNLGKVGISCFAEPLSFLVFPEFRQSENTRVSAVLREHMHLCMFRVGIGWGGLLSHSMV